MYSLHGDLLPEKILSKLQRQLLFCLHVNIARVNNLIPAELIKRHSSGIMKCSFGDYFQYFDLRLLPFKDTYKSGDGNTTETSLGGDVFLFYISNHLFINSKKRAYKSFSSMNVCMLIRRLQSNISNLHFLSARDSFKREKD